MAINTRWRWELPNNARNVEAAIIPANGKTQEGMRSGPQRKKDQSNNSFVDWRSIWLAGRNLNQSETEHSEKYKF